MFLALILAAATGVFAAPAYEVTVDGTAKEVLPVRCSAMPVNIRWPGHQRELDQTEVCGMVRFDLAKPVKVEVSAPNDFSEVKIRPLSRGVRVTRSSEICATDSNTSPSVAQTSGLRTISFIIDCPGQYSVEFDGPHRNLHLFADPPFDYGVKPGDAGVRYFGPGEHDAGVIEMKTGETLYLDERAVVYGRVFARDADDIRILGRGILDGSRVKPEPRAVDPAVAAERKQKGFAIPNVKRRDAIRLEFCDRVTIDGVIVRDSPLYNVRPICCRDVTIRNVKLVGNWRYNSDGIDMHNCERVRISDSFIRTFDDAICIKGFDYTMKDDQMFHDGCLHDAFHDVVVERCVVWNDWGKTLAFGAETRAREISGVTFRDIDVIHPQDVVLDVRNVDSAEIHDVLYENIRVENDCPVHAMVYGEKAADFDSSKLMTPALFVSTTERHPEYTSSKRVGRNHGITVRNVRITGGAFPKAYLSGCRGGEVSDTVFDGIYRDGRDITYDLIYKANIGAFAERPVRSRNLVTGIPCLQNPTADSVEIAWAVDGLSYGAVEVADNPEMKNAKTFSAPERGLQRPERQLVRVRLYGLDDARFYYRPVTIPVTEYRDCYNFTLGDPVKGEVRSFVLPSRNGLSHFAVINDTHGFPEPIQRVFAKVKELDPALLVWNGDIVNSLEKEKDAIDAVIRPEGAEEYAAARPCLYTMGNHEYRGTWSRRLGDVMPAKNAAVRCGDIAIVTLDTGEPIPDESPKWRGFAAFGPMYAAEAKWLESALKRPEISSAPFLVVVCHVPIAKQDGSIMPGMEDWAKLLDEAGAQLVIAGHTHVPRYDGVVKGHRWAQIVGGGPILGEFEGDNGHMDLPDYFPTVIDVEVRNGRLCVTLHDLWRMKNFGVIEYEKRSAAQQAVLRDVGVWMKAKGDGYAKVFRCDYDEVKPFSIDVTADLWYVLKLDGKILARARANNAVKSWLYDTFELPAGKHRVEAVVYHGGPEGYKPLAQETVEAAFYCRGLAGWTAANVPRENFNYGGNTGNAFGAGLPNIVKGASPEYLRLPDTAFNSVDILRKVEPPNVYHHRFPGWRLEKSPLPPHVATVHKVLQSPLAIPANVKTNVVLKLGNYYTAYPIVMTRGGKDAKIRCAWSESEGKLARGICFEDTFRSPGKFTTSWLRSGTLVDLRVETAAEPLTIESFDIEESRYPLDTRGYFECDDASVNEVVNICKRGLEMCAHEGVWDCPFFEQLTYLGDCRVQFLAQNAIGCDDRLQKRCLELFAMSRDSDGMMPMNYPCLGPQSLSATYTLIYPILLRDYVRWHTDREWVKKQLPVLMNVMYGLSRYENGDGLLEDLPGWCFMDWTTWPGTDPAVGSDASAGKLSAFENLFFILALDSAAEVARACGHARTADIFASRAASVRGTVPKLLGSVPRSEHEWALAKLAGVLPASWGTVPEKRNEIPRCSVYFSHYLFEAGGLSPFLEGLSLWKGYVKKGFSTPLEMPEPSRSDCHGWGAHPLYHLATEVAGVCPRESFFKSVRISPNPGPFKRIRCGVPHSKGMIEVDFRFEGGRCRGTVTLPEGLSGIFEYGDLRRALDSGVTSVD